MFEKEKIPKEKLHLVMGYFEKESVRKQIVKETIEKFNQLDILGEFIFNFLHLNIINYLFSVNNVGVTGLKSKPMFSIHS